MFRPTIGGGIIFFPPFPLSPLRVCLLIHTVTSVSLTSFLKDESIKGIQKKNEKKKKLKLALQKRQLLTLTGAEKGRRLHCCIQEIHDHGKTEQMQEQELGSVRALMEEAGSLCQGFSLQ